MRTVIAIYPVMTFEPQHYTISILIPSIKLGRSLGMRLVT